MGSSPRDKAVYAQLQAWSSPASTDHQAAIPAAMAATAKLTLLLPITLTSTISFPTRLVLKSFPLPQRLIVVAASASPSAQTLSSSTPSLETPEARQIRLETESALEWGGVCARLADFAATAAGRAVCVEGRVAVGRSREESEMLIEQTAATVLLSAPLDFAGVEDVSGIVAAATGGRLLAVRQICAVGRSIRAARGVFDQLQNLAEETQDGRYSPLLDILQGCDFLTELVQRIEFCLDSTFSVVLDRASKKLETIRRERRRNIEMLESLLKDTAAKIFQAGGIDSPVVTKRRSRMCVGVKASHKHLVPGGIVLSSSGSGATYFMEPRDAVELNNREVKLSGDERAEELVILGLLTSTIADSQLKIRNLMEKVLELDLACARGSYALWTNGVRPSFSDSYSSSQSDQSSEYSVYIEGIRHPVLLEQSLMAEGSTVDASEMPVPLDIWVKKDARIVVISGPNTGGKTASMKTLGLSSLMSKAGMFFPAKGRPMIPWFDQVLADIGDHQSLEHSLSTFSGHISRLRKIVEVASEDSLVLIDEIGSGTDPSEGVALSTSILKYLASKVNLAIVTTHYADLSRLQSVDSRFENAAMEFCVKTLQPTYRILWGSAGNSNALSIAKSIGFDQKVLDRAQEWVEKLLPDKQKERQGLLYDSLLDERNILESQANEAASVLSQVEGLYNEIRSEADDLESRVAALRTIETQKVQQELKVVKSQMDTIIKNFEVQLKNSKLEQYNSLMRKAEAATASVVAAHQPDEITFSDDENQTLFVPQIGDKVYIQGLGGETMATVIETLGEDGSCMVQYGKIKVQVKRSKMKLVQRGANEAATSSSVKPKASLPASGSRVWGMALRKLFVMISLANCWADWDRVSDLGLGKRDEKIQSGSKWLKKTHRNPLYKAMEKMKEEMMLLGFISLLLAATSRIISGICIDSKFYNSRFSPCTKEEVEESLNAEHAVAHARKHLIEAILHHSLRRNLKARYHNHQGCPEGHESFVSHEGLEQLHRFIFVMAVTHVTYSCLTMLLAILKIHKWRKWEDEAFRDNHESFSQIAYESATRRQPALTKSYSFRSWSQNNVAMWIVCFIAQFGQSVVRADYLILRKGFIMTHNLSPTYDFHNYMIRSMEEEFEKIVGVSGVLWGFVVAFMLFNVDGSNLYFWIAILPVALVLLVGAKLQHVIATLTAEGAKLTTYGPRIQPRDDLFWFKKPEFLLWLIHFVLFQNAFELASFFWFWWQFGYDSCFIKNHLLVYCRLILGFAGQFLCSYSTLPVYALVTQMGSKYKAALIPRRIRETIHGWGKATRKKRRRRRGAWDDSTVRTETSTVCSLTDEDEDDLDDHHHGPFEETPRAARGPPPYLKVELQQTQHGPFRAGTPCFHPVAMPGSISTHGGGSSSHPMLLRQPSSASAPSSPSYRGGNVTRSASMPGIASLRTGTGTPTHMSHDESS